MTLGIGIKYLISISVLAVILFTEPIYKQSFFDKSFTYIPKIQEGASDVKKNFWHFYSDWCLTAITGLPTLVSFIISD